MASKKIRSLFHRLIQMLKSKKADTKRQNCDLSPKDKAISQTKGVSPLPPNQVRTSNQPDTIIGKGKLNVGPARQTEHQFFDGIPENADQFDWPGGSQLVILLGVDFGTSSTKIVVRVPYYTDTPAFAVPFGDHAQQSLKYLLPTRLFVNNNGYCSLKSMPGTTILTDIKLGLMQDPQDRIKPVSGPSCDASATTLATAYLALVLRYVRCWFLAEKRGIFGEYSLSWFFNLGLPAAVDDDAKLHEAFDTLGKAAWLLSRRAGPITIDAAQGAINDIKTSRFNADCNFALIPEVIAEVLGYAKSPLRNEGLHLLVDIGASTLDVCSFNLHVRDGDDHFPILTADIDLLGANRLHKARIDAAGEAVIDTAANLVDESDPGSVIPDNFEDYIPPNQKIDQEIRHKLTTAESDFNWKCEKLIRRTIIDLRNNRDPRSSRWSEKLPVFVCGGGRNMKMYKNLISKVHYWLRDQYIISSEGIRRIDLPKPESLEAEIDEKSYHRLAVAWGLSHESFNIGEYTRPGHINDISPRERSNWEDAYTSKDEV